MPMAYAGLVLGLVLFAVLVRRLGIVEKVRDAGGDTRTALAVVRMPDMDEARKEAALQNAARHMGGVFLDVLARSAAAVLAAGALVYAGTLAGAYTVEEAVAASVDPYALVALTVLAVVIWRLRP